MPRAIPQILANSIRYFTESSKGTGRGENDARNKAREYILAILLTPAVDKFFTDPTYGPQWQTLHDAWRAALVDVATRNHITSYINIVVHPKGGLSYNRDMDVGYVCADGLYPKLNTEFKFGGTSVSTIPQVLSVGANKPFHPSIPYYADFFYDNYLDAICDLYTIPRSEKPAKDLYLKHLYNMDAKIPFLQRLDEAERAEVPNEKGPKYKAKSALVDRSISTYLATCVDKTDLGAVSAELQRSQAGKNFLLYNNGVFHYDRIEDDELIITHVIGVKGNNLVLQSAKPTTTYNALLRWKNHKGVLYPAWQISLKRIR